MPMWMERIRKTPTVSGGAWEFSTRDEYASPDYKMTPRFLSQIYVRAATATTTFDVLIIDENDFQIRRFITATEFVNDLTPTPIVGHIKIRIQNSTVDEAFQVLLIFTDNSG